MRTRFSLRTEGLSQSEIRRMSRECDRAGGINLGQGICDQAIEEVILQGASRALRDGHSQYSRFEGIDALRAGIAGKAASYNAISCDPDTQVVVTVGSTGAFALACLTLLDPGDQAVVFSPYYAYHVNTIRLCGAEPVFVPLKPPQWTFSRSDLEAAISERTRLVVVNTPCNPCGKVFDVAELEQVGRAAARADAVVVTDEIYEYILFDRRRHVSLASLPGMAGRTVTVSGFSKTYSMTGWRLGYSIAPPEISRRMGLLNDLLYVCAPTPLQHAVVEAFRLSPRYYEDLRASYQAKRDLLASACRASGLEPYIPQGAYYLLADVASLGCRDDHEAAATILREAGVATIPGSAFFADPEEGRQMVRFCFAKEMQALEEAARGLEKLRR